jgi:hypothetical protein
MPTYKKLPTNRLMRVLLSDGGGVISVTEIRNSGTLSRLA